METRKWVDFSKIFISSYKGELTKCHKGFVGRIIHNAQQDMDMKSRGLCSSYMNVPAKCTFQVFQYLHQYLFSS